MSATRQDGETFTVRNVDRFALEIIRTLAAKHRVTQAEVLELALVTFEDSLGRTIELPDGWTKPRDW